MDANKIFITTIINKLSQRVERDLTAMEEQAFSIKRSVVENEIIFDLISDSNKSKEEIEQYIYERVEEYFFSALHCGRGLFFVMQLDFISKANYLLVQ